MNTAEHKSIGAHPMVCIAAMLLKAHQDDATSSFHFEEEKG
jgi:hypothetical protein